VKTSTKRPTRKDFQLITGAKVRNARYASAPTKYWLDVGKRISLEMTAARHSFTVKGGSR
jgi:hypothetical protein